jgi:hypothetical protein
VQDMRLAVIACAYLAELWEGGRVNPSSSQEQ